MVDQFFVKEYSLNMRDLAHVWICFAAVLYENCRSSNTILIGLVSCKCCLERDYSCQISSGWAVMDVEPLLSGSNIV
jgi:hypothetical protein